MEVVEDANISILQDEERYLKYILQQTENIIQDYNITYADIQDTRKIYPKFTLKQFTFILQMLNKRVYTPNTALLHDSVYINRYDVQKVELCFKVFSLFCTYYNMTYNINLFSIFSGVEKVLLINWLNTGKSRLYLAILEKTKGLDDAEMLNSSNALLRLHYRNNEELEHLEEGTADILPDLLLPGSTQKALNSPQD